MSHHLAECSGAKLDSRLEDAASQTVRSWSVVTDWGRGVAMQTLRVQIDNGN